MTDTVHPDVALSGLAGSGKDTAAQALVDQLGYTVGKFAAPLYDAVLKLDPWIDAGQHDAYRLSILVRRHGWEATKRMYPEARRLLQVFGTEVGRQMFGADFWVERAARWRLTVDGPVVWTDTRFPNEVDYVTGGRVMRHPLSQRGGRWVHLIRPGQQTEGAGHASESSLPALELADHIVVNDGSVADLHAILARLIR